MTFQRTAPQAVTHADGYRVYVHDRYHVAYEEPAGKAVLGADLDGGVRVFAATLAWSPAPLALPAEEVLRRVVAGFAAMGLAVEVVHEDP